MTHKITDYYKVEINGVTDYILYCSCGTKIIGFIRDKVLEEYASHCAGDLEKIKRSITKWELRKDGRENTNLQKD